jgi:hypothetical protein
LWTGTGSLMVYRPFPQSGDQPQFLPATARVSNQPMKQLDMLELVEGLDFPISREDLVRLAQERGAGNEVIAALRSLPATEFASADELDEALTIAE